MAGPAVSKYHYVQSDVIFSFNRERSSSSSGTFFRLMRMSRNASMHVRIMVFFVIRSFL